MSACEMGSVNLSAVWLADGVLAIHSAYVNFHPYVAVALCLAGTVMNLVTVMVLTRPSMQSPINTLLCAVALCDILVMSSVLIFVSHFLIVANMRCDVTDYSRGWAYFLFVHAQTTVIFHATSIWLTVLLAQIRVYTIKKATTGPTEAVNTRSTIMIACITLIVVVLVNIPNFLTFQIVEHSSEGFCSTDQNDSKVMSEEHNSTVDQDVIYQVIASENDCGLLQVAFWTNGILFKVIPCLMLTFSIVALVTIIRDLSQRRKCLAQVMNKKKMPSDHTTPMLVAVLSIFLIAELPQGILHVCNAIFSKGTFYTRIYQPLGDLMDLLSLLNSAVNFIIYCAMSRKFRCVFLQLFISILPESLYRKYLQEWPGALDMEVSRQKPSGMTDLTRTEQLALTSHRVSATSMLIRTTSKENVCSKMYSGNLLTVAPSAPSSRRLSSPRVSFDTQEKESFEVCQSPDLEEFHLNVPKAKKAFLIRNPLASLRDWLEKAVHDSPQRRMDLIRFETSTANTY